LVVPVRKHSADPIIVLGVERSGTSVVAEMIHRWGAYAGDQEKPIFDLYPGFQNGPSYRTP